MTASHGPVGFAESLAPPGPALERATARRGQGPAAAADTHTVTVPPGPVTQASSEAPLSAATRSAAPQASASAPAEACCAPAKAARSAAAAAR